MHIDYTEEQNMLRDSADKYLRENYSFDKRQAVVADGSGFSQDQWRTFAELGWLAMPFKEEYGGFEAGAVETMLLNEAFGRNLVLEPWIETVALAGGMLQAGATDAICERYLPGIAEGSVQGAFAHAEPGRLAGFDQVECRSESSNEGYVLTGRKVVALNGPAADFFLVTARTSGNACDRQGVSLFVVPADSAGLKLRHYPTYDGRHASDLTLENLVVPPECLVGEEGVALTLVEKVLDQVLLALCAEAVGAMEALVEATVDYTTQRKQFGTPIATFQVLRHRMTDMFIQKELTRSLLMATAVKLDAGSPEAPAMVAALKAKVGKAGRYVGQNAIQLHGGIGMTNELALGHYFKRLTAIENLFGSRDYYLSRYNQLTESHH